MLRIPSSHIRDVINLSLPMAGSRFIQMFSGFIGMLMVAHLGRTVLAASALINSTFSTILLFAMSIVFAVSFVTGQIVGANRHDQIGEFMQQSLLLSLLLGLLMMPFFWYAGAILHFFHQKPEMIFYAIQYFHAMMWAAIPILLQTCMQQFLYGILKQRFVISVNLLTMVIGIPIAYVLIFGKYGAPAYGIAGVAYTFAIQSTLGFLIYCFACLFHSDLKGYQLFKKYPHQNARYFFKVLSIGWPMSIQFGGELLAFFVVAMMIGWLGVNALAAVQVTQQWLLLVIVPIFAMSEASAILVGRAVGAKNYASLRDIGRASLLVTLVFVLFLDSLFLFFPRHFAALYLDVSNPANRQIMHLIRSLFIVLTVTLVLSAGRDIISGLLRGMYDTRFPMQIGLFVMWCLVVPIGYFMAFVMGWGVIGFKAGGCVGLFIGAMLVYWRWLKKTQKVF